MKLSVLRDLCENFYFNNYDSLTKTEIVSKFRDFGVKKATAYRYYDSLSSDLKNR